MNEVSEGHVYIRRTETLVRESRSWSTDQHNHQPYNNDQHTRVNAGRRLFQNILIELSWWFRERCRILFVRSVRARWRVPLIHTTHLVLHDLYTQVTVHHLRHGPRISFEDREILKCSRTYLSSIWGARLSSCDYRHARILFQFCPNLWFLPPNQRGLAAASSRQPDTMSIWKFMVLIENYPDFSTSESLNTDTFYRHHKLRFGTAHSQLIRFPADTLGWNDFFISFRRQRAAVLMA